MELILNFILGTITVSRNNLLKVIPVVHKDWSLSVEINPSGIIGDWASIIRVGPGVVDFVAYGDRAPAIFFYPGTTRLHVTNSVNGLINYSNDPPTHLPINKWTKLDVGQSLHADGYHYILSIDGNVVYDIINTVPQEFTNMKVSSS